MSDEFATESAPKNRKPRTPYKRTGLDDELLVVRQVNAKLQKLPSQESRLRALSMIQQYVEKQA